MAGTGLMRSGCAPHLAFVVTEDWYFWSHRMALARAAREAGYRVSVVTRPARHAERMRSEGLHVEPWAVDRARVAPWSEALSVWRLAGILRRLRPDLVHNVAIKPVVYGTIAAVLCGSRPRVVNALAGLGFVFASDSPRARLLRPALRLLLRRLLARPGVSTICQNPQDLDLLREGGVPQSALRLVRGAGVDTEHFAPTPEPAGPVTVTMVSRMLRNKGAVELVEAARKLRERGAEVRVRLVGAPDPGNPASLTRATLEGWAREGVIEWLGHRDDIAAVWAESHVAALPSNYGEGLPKALLEAAACGRALVATDIPGCREIVRPGETGLLVEPGNAAALADAIERLAGDPAARRRMGERARAVVEAEFADRHVVAAVLGLYAELLGR